MSAQDPTRDFDDSGGSGSTDDSSDFFDEDTDYSTDIEGESLDDRFDVSRDRDDDDDDDRGGFSLDEEGGAAPAPGDPGAPSPDGTTEPSQPSPDDVADEQGAEADPADRRGEITPGEAAAARELEQRVLDLNPELTAADIRITGTDPEEFGIELTPSARQRFGMAEPERAPGYLEEGGAAPAPGDPGAPGPAQPEQPSVRDPDATGGLDLGGADPTDPRQTTRGPLAFDQFRLEDLQEEAERATRGERSLFTPEAPPPGVEPDVGPLLDPRLFEGDPARRILNIGARGSPEAETARNIAFFGTSLLFGSGAAESVQRSIGLEGERVGDPVVISGPEVGLGGITAGRRGAFDPDVAERLTRGRGLIGEEAEEDVQQSALRAMDRFSRGEEAEAVARDFGLGDTEARFIGGVGTIPGQVAASIPQGVLIADLAAEAGPNLPATVDEFGAGPTLATIVEAGGRVTESTIREAEENPARFAGQLGGEILLGTAAARGVTRGVDLGRGAIRRRRAETVVDLDEISPPDTLDAEGTVQLFETDPGVPTTQALQEVRRRAADQPTSLQRLGEPNLSEVIGFEIGERVGRRLPEPGAGLRRVREAADRPFQRAEDIGVAGGERVGRGVSEAEDLLDIPFQRAEEVGFVAGERVAAGITRGGDLFDVPFQRPRDIFDAPFTRAEDIGFVAGERVGRGVGAVDDLFERAEAIGFAAGERVGRRIQDRPDFLDAPFRRAEDVGFVAGERVGAGISGLENLLGRAEAATVGRAAAPFERRAFAAGEQLGGFIGDVESRMPSRGVPDSLLFRSESEAIEGAFDVEAGRFELPGLFASPDLSRLRLQEGAQTSRFPSVRFGLPRVRDPGDQVTLFPGERIEAMPERSTGAGFAFTPEGERIPDPATSGAQFLQEEAERGTAFVRPTGSRSAELEAIFPPGSRFEEFEPFAVRGAGGRTIPGLAFTRGEQPDAPATLSGVPGVDLPETRLSRVSRGLEPEPLTVPPTTLPSPSPRTTPTDPVPGLSETVATTAAGITSMVGGTSAGPSAGGLDESAPTLSDLESPLSPTPSSGPTLTSDPTGGPSFPGSPMFPSDPSGTPTGPTGTPFTPTPTPETPPPATPSLAFPQFDGRDGGQPADVAATQERFITRFGTVAEATGFGDGFGIQDPVAPDVIERGGAPDTGGLDGGAGVRFDLFGGGQDGLGDDDVLADLDEGEVLGGPSTPTAFQSPFQDDKMLAGPREPSVTGLESPGATPPGGSLPASVSNALFDGRDRRGLF